MRLSIAFNLIVIIMCVILTNGQIYENNVFSHNITKRSTDSSSDLSKTEIRTLRRELKKKRRKFRKLRDEIKEIRVKLYGDKPRSKTLATTATPTVTISSDKPRRQVPRPKSEQNLSIKWQRKVMRQLRMLNRRVDDLETESSSEGQSKRKGGRRHLRRRITELLKEHKRNGTFDIVDEPVKVAGPTQRPIDTSGSLLGWQGTLCTSHESCAPGLCCHRTSNETTVCAAHRLDDRVACEHSCQCKDNRHCFRANSVESTTRSGVCREVRSEDILNGVYLNKPLRLFDMDNRDYVEELT